MAVETEKFVITEVDFAYTESREITVNRKAPIKTGISAATLYCKKCEHLWRSRPFGDGKFDSPLGSFIFKCPDCNESEAVKASVVMGTG